MSRWQMARIWFSLGGVSMLLGLGCGAGSPVVRQPPMESPAEIQPDAGESIVSRGSPDLSNRYGAAVLVDGGEGLCSGALIAPRVVLTARERGSALELVGIAKTYYGGQDLVQFSEYTNTYFYLDWLRREIASAERDSTD